MPSLTIKKSFPWPNDCDSRERGCTIMLMVRDILGRVAEHWALYFEWTDHGSATYEAFDKNGYLIPTWNRGKPDESYSWRVKQISEKRCSPKEVNSVARQIALSGQRYFVAYRNCHHWAIALASAFDVCISGPPENNMHNDLRIMLELWYCANKATGQVRGLSTASKSGDARAVISTGSQLSGTSLNVSNVIADNLTDAPSDHHSVKETSHAGNPKDTSASSSQESARMMNDRRNCDASPIKTAIAVGGALAFAGFAIASLLSRNNRRR